MLVEDDANLCYIIRGGLEDMIGGYEIMTADNGEAGLRIWKETISCSIDFTVESDIGRTVCRT